MARLIDKDALIEKMRFDVCTDCLGSIKGCGNCYYERAINAIDDAPAVDAVEVVHGEWERTQFVGKSGFYNLRDVICSECKTVCSFLYDKNTPMNYCPNCGAKMDGERKDCE